MVFLGSIYKIDYTCQARMNLLHSHSISLRFIKSPEFTTSLTILLVMVVLCRDPILHNNIHFTFTGNLGEHEQCFSLLVLHNIPFGSMVLRIVIKCRMDSSHTGLQK